MSILKPTWATSSIKKADITLTLLSTGDVFSWMHHDYQINLLQGNPLDGMIANLYLREKLPTGYRVTKLMGVHSPSHWKQIDDGAIYEGTFSDVHYQVILKLQPQGWVYQLQLLGTNPDAEYDVMYGQDVGIAHPFGILSNEAYTSQYIDHHIYHHDDSFTVLSRQNQGQTHYLQLGSDFPLVAYATDSMQFFGLSYKRDHQPIAYQLPQLPSTNYQYEFSYISLQTKPFRLQASPFILHFYAYSHREDGLMRTTMFPQPVMPTIHIPHVNGAIIKPLLNPTTPLAGIPLTKEMYHTMFPELMDLESENEILLSGFFKDHRHLITQQKELMVERMHGHILLSGDVLHATENVFATTAYMTGIFGSHTVYGNTNFHKLTGDLRHPLNAHTISGTRIYLETEGHYRLLGIPSYLVMGLDHVQWVYVLRNDTLTITLRVNGIDPISKLTFVSKENRSYQLKITQQFLIDTNEYQHAIQYRFDGRVLEIDGRSNPMIANHYPGLRYRISADQPYQLGYGHDLVASADGHDGGMMVLSVGYTSHFTLFTEATLSGQFSKKPESYEFGQHYETLIKALVPLHLSHDTKQEEVASLNFLVPWYVHDALVHYASPHGLEQYNGAAWGTRDVLQGPFELFLTAQRFDLNRDILLKVFSRQFSDTKEFPQWFMFDEYRHIQAHESHGDVLVWPLKALGQYLASTGDETILSIPLPYMDKQQGKFTQDLFALRDHVWDIIDTLKASVIPGTSLPAYGGGDWDDTLQPANATLTKSMVSGWTVALLYEALESLCEFTIFSDDRQQDLIKFKDNLKRDFDRYLLIDDVPAGFVIFYPDHQEYLLHPRDQQTGLTYRLLPFNRGMISEIFDPKLIPSFQSIIHEHLRHPDGVRLMNTAVTYRGGKKTFFQRAETAANFGREIGIQYVHAHIRYIEAMTVIGDPVEAWWGLHVINPIGINTHVPTSEKRQRNVYFSSSDAAFLDRYQAKKDFEKVRKGTIKVKAGWRLYSSGPGIYLHTLIQKVLGIRMHKGLLVIDPQLPPSLVGLKVDYKSMERTLRMAIDALVLTDEIANRYRKKNRVELKTTLTHVDVIVK